MTICGPGSVVPEGVVLPEIQPPCCVEAAIDGPQACTCWEYVFDVERSPQFRLYDVITPASPIEMCADCAFRPGSPEKADDPEVRASAEQLDRCVTRGEPFWCHDGMPKVIGFRHPSGAYVDFPSEHAFQPLMVQSDHATVPFRADGRPALLCSGWWLQRRKHLERHPVDPPA